MLRLLLLVLTFCSISLANGPLGSVFQSLSVRFANCHVLKETLNGSKVFLCFNAYVLEGVKRVPRGSNIQTQGIFITSKEQNPFDVHHSTIDRVGNCPKALLDIMANGYYQSPFVPLNQSGFLISAYHEQSLNDGFIGKLYHVPGSLKWLKPFTYQYNLQEVLEIKPHCQNSKPVVLVKEKNKLQVSVPVPTLASGVGATKVVMEAKKVTGFAKDLWQILKLSAPAVALHHFSNTDSSKSLRLHPSQAQALSIQNEAGKEEDDHQHFNPDRANHSNSNNEFLQIIQRINLGQETFEDRTFIKKMHEWCVSQNERLADEFCQIIAYYFNKLFNQVTKPTIHQDGFTRVQPFKGGKNIPYVFYGKNLFGVNPEIYKNTHELLPVGHFSLHNPDLQKLVYQIEIMLSELNFFSHRTPNPNFYQKSLKTNGEFVVDLERVDLFYNTFLSSNIQLDNYFQSSYFSYLIFCQLVAARFGLETDILVSKNEPRLVLLQDKMTNTIFYSNIKNVGDLLFNPLSAYHLIEENYHHIQYYIPLRSKMRTNSEELIFYSN